MIVRKVGLVHLEDNYRCIHSKVHREKELITYGAAAVLIGLMLFSVFLSINMGKAYIGIKDILCIIAGKITGNENLLSNVKETYVAIVWSIRLPRILCAILVGSGLAVSGAVFQSILMNPLADSYTMGVSTGAAFGASIGIFINIMDFGYYVPITIFAFGGAILTLIIVIALSRVRGFLSPVNLILSGVIVSSVLSAGITLIKNAAGENVSAIVGWMMGSLSSSKWDDVMLVFPVIAIGSAVCMSMSYSLNILSMGDVESRYLGVDPERLRKIFLICGSMITAVCVSISGIIGFVGLIVPHILRMLIGSDNRKLIPFSILLGGELLLIADTCARAILSREIPVGVITTLLGGPFFLYVFIKRNNGK